MSVSDPKPFVYPVNDMYHSIQGEGAMAGTPMVITRLHGCNVGCFFCDTKETWKMEEGLIPDEAIDGGKNFRQAFGKNSNWAYLSPYKISRIARDMFDRINPRYENRWVLLTGGEPSLYPLGMLVHAFHDVDIKVALETSGTALGHLDNPMCDWICVSPKIKNPAKLPIEPLALRTAHEIKMVVGKKDDVFVLDELLEESEIDLTKTIISLQPMSMRQGATRLCIETCKERGWRLSLQTHKYLDLP